MLLLGASIAHMCLAFAYQEKPKHVFDWTCRRVAKLVETNARTIRQRRSLRSLRSLRNWRAMAEESSPSLELEDRQIAEQIFADVAPEQLGPGLGQALFWRCKAASFDKDEG